MTRDLIEQTLRPAFWGAIALALVLGLVGAVRLAAGFLAGAVWNVLNLTLLRALALTWAREQRRRAGLLLLTKLFVLYPLGLALALSTAFSVIGMVVGFSWVFVVLIGLAAWPRRNPPPLVAEVPRG